MKNGFKIIDVDVHAQEGNVPYKERLEEPYRSRTLVRQRGPGKQAIKLGPTVVSEISGEQGTPLFARQSLGHIPSIPHLAAANAPCGTPQVYLEGFEIEGIDVGILVPQTVRHMTTTDGLDGDHALALSRAYNDHAYDWTATAPDRFKFWAWLPRQDAELAAKEARRCVKNGAIGVAMTQVAVDGNLLCDEFFDPLWEELNSLDVPVAFHVIGTQSKLSLRDRTSARYDGHPKAEVVADSLGIGGFQAHTTIAELILGGVLERFPKIKPVILESNAGWIPWLVWGLDEKWETYGPYTSSAKLSMRPSDYFRERCYVAVDPHEAPIKYAIDYVGDDHLLFSIDYPHHDGMFPNGTSTFLALGGISDESKRKILWDNAVRLFGLDASEERPR